MPKPKNTAKLVVTSVVISLVVIAIFALVFLNWIVPAYQVTETQIYGVLIKLFPVLIGLILIQIGCMIARKNEDDFTDQVDRLPPNAYTKPYESAAKDDPMNVSIDAAKTQETVSPAACAEVAAGGEPAARVEIREVPVEREVVREVPVEVPVEVIREVEKEVPVIREVVKEVIREVPVTSAGVPVAEAAAKETAGASDATAKVEIREVPVEIVREVEKEVPVEVVKEVFVEVPSAPETVEIIKEVLVEAPGATAAATEARETQVIKEIVREVPVEVIKEIPVPVEVEVEKEVVREVRVEVPVEKIVEVPVEKEVIREVTVEVPAAEGTGAAAAAAVAETPYTTPVDSDDFPGVLASECAAAREFGYDVALALFRKDGLDCGKLSALFGGNAFVIERDSDYALVFSFCNEQEAKALIRAQEAQLPGAGWSVASMDDGTADPATLEKKAAAGF